MVAPSTFLFTLSIALSSTPVYSIPVDRNTQEKRFFGLPSIKSKLGLEKVNTPTEVFNIPSYGKWTGDGWSIRLHGTAYKPLPYTNKLVDKLGDAFIVGYPKDQITPAEKQNIRNTTRTLFSYPQKKLDLNFDLQLDGNSVGSLEFPEQTGRTGEFDGWVALPKIPWLHDGDSYQDVQNLQVYTESYANGNSTTFLIPPQGQMVISDIDDILRDTRVWMVRVGLYNTFARSYIPIAGMPEVFDRIAKTSPGTAFHYVTTTPQQSARRYAEFVLNYYPAGSFDFRPMSVKSMEQTFHNRRKNIQRAVETFPQRKFILIGDNSNTDLVKAYADMGLMYPDRIQCILMRNVSATVAPDFHMAGTDSFAGISSEKYQFFRTPDDLAGIDFANGGCRNYTFAQNVTFSHLDSTQQTASIAWGTLKDLLHHHHPELEVNADVDSKSGPDSDSEEDWE